MRIAMIYIAGMCVGVCLPCVLKNMCQATFVALNVLGRILLDWVVQTGQYDCKHSIYVVPAQFMQSLEVG